MQAMIFAAGLGTRLRPLTDKLPKALIKINGVPILEHVIRRLIEFGYNEIVVNVHHHAGQIIAFLESKDNFGIRMHISDERKKLLDIGGGLKKAAPNLSADEPILLHNVDVLSRIDFRAMLDHHHKTQADVTLAVSHRRTIRKLVFDTDDRLAGWRDLITGEQKGAAAANSNLRTFGFSGIHIINPAIFRYFPAEDIFPIIDFYLNIRKKCKIRAFPHHPLLWMDIGRPEELQKAARFLNREDSRPDAIN